MPRIDLSPDELSWLAGLIRVGADDTAERLRAVSEGGG